MRIAIVNDMTLAVEALRRVVRSKPGYTIAWIARDGAEAVRLCAADKPDIILMDLIMPVMNGVEATHRIMHESPCAILVVTATVEGNIALVFEAMGHGALDAVNTPTLGADSQVAGGQNLLAKIEIVGRLIHSSPVARAKKTHLPTHPGSAEGLPHLVVMGASTGGPGALAVITATLPHSFPAAIVVIQHIDMLFAPDLAGWLGHHTPLEVKVATAGCRPAPGVILMSGTNDHLIMTPDRTLTYSQEPLDCFYRPSVDIFFKSLAAYWPGRGTAVLLTGMGRDGAEGLLALREAGWQTIAQDQATSVVFGMPKAAAKLHAAEYILSLSDIGPVLLNSINRKKHTASTKSPS